MDDRMVKNDEMTPFAELVGRLVLFPLSWIDRAATARKLKKQAKAEAEEGQRQEEVAAKLRAEDQERAAKQAAERKILEEREAATLDDAKIRSEKARYRCQLLYDQHEYKIRDKFPQEKLERYFEQYMNDEFPVDLIERRGQDLEVMIRGFLGDDKPKKPSSRVEIKAFFDLQRADAKAAGLAQEVLEATLVDINAREDQAIMDFRDTI